MAKQILIKDSKLKDLKPDPDNPRTISEEKLSSLRKSLEEFGDLSCIVYNELEDKLVGAHQRLKIFSSSSKIVITDKYKKPNRQGTIREGYVLIDGEKFKYRVVRWTKEKHKAAMLAANKHSGEWDQKKLAEIVESLKGSSLDFGLTGFDFGDFPKIFPEENKKGLVDDDFVPDPKKTNIKLGDIFELGDHRLMCGDATLKNDVDKLMNGQLADMVHTDPPYNIAYSGGSKKRENIANDDLKDFNGFLFNAYSQYARVLKKGGCIYVWHASTETHNFISEFIKSGFLFKSYIIWNKDNSTFGRSDYHWKHEPAIYGWKDGGAHKWHGDRKQTTVWDVKRPSRSDDHPTMKPIDLCDIAIKNSSKKGQLILDFFCGSGSTLISCEKNERKCYAMELSPNYCQVIIDRWEAYTGRKAVKVSK